MVTREHLNPLRDTFYLQQGLSFSAEDILLRGAGHFISSEDTLLYRCCEKLYVYSGHFENLLARESQSIP